jgi:hypothetical protein
MNSLPLESKPIPVNFLSKQPTINIKNITAMDIPTLRLELDKIMNDLRKMSEELDRACQALREKRSQEDSK